MNATDSFAIRHNLSVAICNLDCEGRTLPSADVVSGRFALRFQAPSSQAEWKTDIPIEVNNFLQQVTAIAAS